MIIPETYFSVSEETKIFLYSCVLGAVYGVFCDFFRAVRAIFPHNSVLVAIEDIFCLIVYSVSIITFASVFARGEFRFYYVLGSIIGFAVYFFTVGSVVIKIIRYILKIVLKILRFIFYPLKKIYVAMCEKVAVKFVRNSQNIIKSFKNIKKPLIERAEMLYNNKTNNVRKNVKCVGKKKKREQKKKTV